MAPRTVKINNQYTNPTATTQAAPIPGSEYKMKKNAAGGYTFVVDEFTRMERFLILGTEKPTYYASAQKMTKENAVNVYKAIKKDPERALELIRNISTTRRAAKNDPALFALAMIIAADAEIVSSKTIIKAKQMIPEIARTATDLFTFVGFVQSMRGWGRSLRKAVACWYNGKSIPDLVYQVTKYRNRNGWTHRDVLRLAHVRPVNEQYNGLYKWIIGQECNVEELVPELVPFLKLQKAVDAQDVVELIESNSSLTWEMIPSEFLKDPTVWKALIPNMPIMALVRNLARMTANGTLTPLSKHTRAVCDKIKRQANSLHPIFVLQALNTYRQGHGDKGSLTWQPLAPIVSALDEAFTDSFQHVKPTGKNFYLGIDVSPSMWGAQIMNLSMSSAEAAAVMAMATVRSEENCYVAAFASAHTSRYAHDRSSGVAPMLVDKTMSLKEVQQVAKSFDNRWSRTDCALPVLDALKQEIMVDVFVIYTDNESFAGDTHVVQALRKYREAINPKAKMVVCAFTASDASIADPDDGGMLDVVGFDSATPSVISNFATE